jgi:epoxyqueuosine reductase
MIRELIREKALSLGFSEAGIVPSTFLEKEYGHLKEWLASGYSAEMEYMERNAGKRSDPRILFEQCRSVIVVFFNYRQPDYHSCISEYACGEDYHVVMKNKLRLLDTYIAELAGSEYRSRLFTDSAPVMEKSWAVRSGMGWQGRNALVLHPELGSKFYIGGILTNLDIADEEVEIQDNLCADCRLCIDACPTSALIYPGVLNANLCIAYHTIENKGDIPPAVASEMKDSIYGCDICQNVCPWNVRNKDNISQVYKALDHTRIKPEDWLKLKEGEFSKLCGNTVMTRAGLNRIKKSASIVISNRKK